MMIHPVLEMLSNFLLDLDRQLCPRIIHGQQHPFDHQIRVKELLDETDRQQQLRDALQRIIFTLHRDHHRISRGERIGVEQAQRRRTVDDDVIITRLDRIELLFQQLFLAALKAHHFQIGAGQGDVRRNDVDRRLAQMFDDIIRLIIFHQQIIYGRLTILPACPDPL